MFYTLDEAVALFQQDIEEGIYLMYKYVITFEGLKPNLTITPTETIDPVAFIEKMDLSSV